MTIRELFMVSAVIVVATGCEDALRVAGLQRTQAGPAVQFQAPITLQPPAPPPPHLEALPFRIAECRIDATGFLGLGDNKRVTTRIVNRGRQPGIFTIKVIGLYPGGGEIEHATTAVTIAAGATDSGSIEIVPQPGMHSVRCRVIPPEVMVP